MLVPSKLTKWDYRWLGLAKHVSEWSKDPSTKVGAVIANGKKLISLGYNGFPSSCPDHEEWYLDRELKYKLVTHAELNAIVNSYLPVNGATIYTYPLAVCSHCATLLCSHGIAKVVSQIDLTGTKTARYLDTKDTEFILNANNIEYYWDYIE